MKRILLAVAVAALSLVTLQNASAADIPAPVYKAPAAVVPVWTWTGFYIGAVGGYGWGKSRHCDGGSAPPCDPAFPHFNINGGTFGGTIGYNWQVNRMVLGVEGDGSWAHIKGQSFSVPGFGCGTSPPDTCLTSIRAIATIRGRLGVAWDRFMPYVTAGAAFVQVHGEIAQSLLPGAVDTTWFTRAVAGVGMEYAFTNNWSAKVEYLNIFNIGDHNYDVIGACGVPSCFSRTRDIGLVRGGINYRFSGM